MGRNTRRRTVRPAARWEGPPDDDRPALERLADALTTLAGPPTLETNPPRVSVPDAGRALLGITRDRADALAEHYGVQLHVTPGRFVFCAPGDPGPPSALADRVRDAYG